MIKFPFSKKIAKIGLVCVLGLGLLGFSSLSAAKKAQKTQKTSSSKRLGRNFSAEELLKQAATQIFRGELDSAKDLLNSQSKIKVEGLLEKRLQFLKAWLALKTENFDVAKTGFEALQGHYPEIGPILDYYLAKSARLKGDAKAAGAALLKLCAEERCVQNFRFALEEAEGLCLESDASQATERFALLLTRYPSRAKKDRILLGKTDCLLRTNPSLVVEDLRTLFTSASPMILREDLVLRIKKAGANLTSEDELTRIRALKSQERFALAAAELKLLLGQISEPKDLEAQKIFDEEIADTFFKARFYADAAVYYKKLVNLETDAKKKREWFEKLGSAYARSDQFDAAIQVQSQLLENATENALSEDDKAFIIYKIAFVLADAGRFDLAAKQYADFLAQNGRADLADNALWKKAWVLYRAGQIDAAALEMKSFTARFGQDVKFSKVLFWHRELLQKLGRPDEAAGLEQTLATRFPEAFYPEFKSRYPGQDGPKIGSLPIRVKFAPPLVSSKNTQAETKLLQELASLGLWEDFFEELTTEQKDFALSRTALKNWLEFFANAEGLPPALVAAIMREESHFNAKIVSNAGAVGLLQLIPQTAYETARKLKWESFDAEMLTNPIVNLRLGVHYLATLSAIFDGDLVRMIAAYNGGPEAVKRWSLQRKELNITEFIEEIPYTETHQYVQKVLKSFWRYQASLVLED